MKATQGSDKTLDEFAYTFHSEASPRKLGVDVFPEEITNAEGEVFLVERQVEESESS